MADQIIHKQEFRVRDLSTRSVLLFPYRAQIVRDVKDIALKVSSKQETSCKFSLIALLT